MIPPSVVFPSGGYVAPLAAHSAAPAIDAAATSVDSAATDVPPDPSPLGQTVADPTVEISLQIASPDGTPLATVGIGQAFVVHVYVQDKRSSPEGVFAAYMNLAWTRSLAALDGNVQFGSHFSNGLMAGIDAPGRLDDVGAFSNSQRGLGGEKLEVFRVPMRALGAGTLQMATSAADNSPTTDTLVFGRNRSVPIDQISYGSSLTPIGPASEPAPPEVPAEPAPADASAPTPSPVAMPHVTDTSAQAALFAQITTSDGSPLAALSPGQEFVLHVYAGDLRRDPMGVFAAYLNVRWNPSQAEVAGEIQPSPYFLNGTANIGDNPVKVAGAGRIDDAGGFSDLRPRGGGAFELFQVAMRATGKGDLNFTLAPADKYPTYDVLVYGQNGPVDPSQIYYGGAHITVTDDGAPPPPVVSPAPADPTGELPPPASLPAPPTVATTPPPVDYPPESPPPEEGLPPAAESRPAARGTFNGLAFNSSAMAANDGSLPSGSDVADPGFEPALLAVLASPVAPARANAPAAASPGAALLSPQLSKGNAESSEDLSAAGASPLAPDLDEPSAAEQSQVNSAQTDAGAAEFSAELSDLSASELL